MCVCAFLTQPHRYTIGTQLSRDLLTRILDLWPSKAPLNASAPWDCPDTDMSDGWGILSSKQSNAWITSGNNTFGTPVMPISDLLTKGSAGLRIGNAITLRQRAQLDGLWPSERVHKLVPDDNPKSSGAALDRCSDTIMKTFDATSVAKEIVDDLFPVAQGIYESAPMSFCLR
jgi:hypothetical protein